MILLKYSNEMNKKTSINDVLYQSSVIFYRKVHSYIQIFIKIVKALRYRPVTPVNLETKLIAIMHSSFFYIHPSVEKLITNVSKRYF